MTLPKRVPRIGTRAAVLLLLGFALWVVPGSAQQPAPQPIDVQPAPDSVQAMIAEYQDKQRQYGAIQSQAFNASTELQARQSSISDMVMAALFESYPQAEAQIARLDAIETEAFTAQQAQDMDRLGQLISEAGEVQRALQAAQELVLERPDVESAIATFEADLMAAMVTIDPEAPALRARLDELLARLNASPPPGL